MGGVCAGKQHTSAANATSSNGAPPPDPADMRARIARLHARYGRPSFAREHTSPTSMVVFDGTFDAPRLACFVVGNTIDHTADFGEVLRQNNDIAISIGHLNTALSYVSICPNLPDVRKEKHALMTDNCKEKLKATVQNIVYKSVDSRQGQEQSANIVVYVIPDFRELNDRQAFRQYDNRYIVVSTGGSSKETLVAKSFLVLEVTSALRTSGKCAMTRVDNTDEAVVSDSIAAIKSIESKVGVMLSESDVMPTTTMSFQTVSQQQPMKIRG